MQILPATKSKKKKIKDQGEAHSESWGRPWEERMEAMDVASWSTAREAYWDRSSPVWVHNHSLVAGNCIYKLKINHSTRKQDPSLAWEWGWRRLTVHVPYELRPIHDPGSSSDSNVGAHV